MSAQATILPEPADPPTESITKTFDLEEPLRTIATCFDATGLLDRGAKSVAKAAAPDTGSAIEKRKDQNLNGPPFHHHFLKGPVALAAICCLAGPIMSARRLRSISSSSQCPVELLPPWTL